MSIDHKLLESYMTGFYGYGNESALYWFIGLEEGGGNSLDEIKGQSISDNVTMFRSVMDGKQGPCMDIVTLNAGAALYIAGATGSIKDGQAIAENCIKNGTARAKINQLVEISQRIGIEDKEQDY